MVRGIFGDRGVGGVGMLAGRSLFPLTSVAILAGTILWGPWVTLVLGALWFVVASLLA